MTSYLSKIDSALRAWSAHDLDTYLQLYDSNVTVFGLTPDPTPLDFQGMRGVYEMIFAAFPDMTIERLSAISEGDKVAVHFRVRGTQQGDFQGIPATGRAVTANGMTILRFREGKVVERWNNFDYVSLMQQLGVIPEAAPAAG
ncbi:MAG: ester cyclase [Anaerolineae bacterium]